MRAQTPEALPWTWVQRREAAFCFCVLQLQLIHFETNRAYSEVSWVKPAGFSQTEKTKFTFEYSADTITWTANGKVYAKYTKGTDASLWPYGEPMMLSFSLWTKCVPCFGFAYQVILKH